MDKNNNISDSPTTDYRASIKLLRRSGFLLSGAWLLIAFLLVLWKRDTLSELTLNELGDFMAGVSAPLALLWVIVGYFQQGIELRQNTETLKLQQLELARQVQETATLALHAERQALASERQATAVQEQLKQARALRHQELRPIVKVQQISATTPGTVRFANVGHTIYDVTISDESGFFMPPHKRSIWSNDEAIKVGCRGGAFTALEFALQYRDADGCHWQQNLQLKPSGQLTELQLNPLPNATA